MPEAGNNRNEESEVQQSKNIYVFNISFIPTKTQVPVTLSIENFLLCKQYSWYPNCFREMPLEKFSFIYSTSQCCQVKKQAEGIEKQGISQLMATLKIPVSSFLTKCNLVMLKRELQKHLDMPRWLQENQKTLVTGLEPVWPVSLYISIYMTALCIQSQKRCQIIKTDHSFSHEHQIHMQ